MPKSELPVSVILVRALPALNRAVLVERPHFNQNFLLNVVAYWLNHQDAKIRKDMVESFVGEVREKFATNDAEREALRHILDRGVANFQVSNL